MTSTDAPAVVEVLTASWPLLTIAGFGGMVLFCLKIVEHFNRPTEDKLTTSRYAAFFIFLFFALPVLGTAVVAIYLVNGDKISPVLSFQVGLTSPAIVQSLIIAAANNLSRQRVETSASQ